MSIHVACITCDCGKWHYTAGSGPATRCTCGRLLWLQIWDLKHVGFRGDGTPKERKPR